MTNKIYLAIFFLSGAAGLVYQVVWIRMLALIFGNTTYAISLVVAAFMAGLALGAWYLGAWIDTDKSPARRYAVLEAGIAATAVVMTSVILGLDDSLASMISVDAVENPGWSFIRFVLFFIFLLPPTFLMGGTTPVMSRMFIDDVQTVGAGTGSIYAANTFGAVAGAFVSGFVLVPWLTVSGTFLTAVAANIVCAVAVWWIAGMKDTAQPNGNPPRITEDRKKKKAKHKAATPEVSPAEWEGATLSTGAAYALIAASGFACLAFEILWFRGMMISFKSTTYLFSTFLTVFLTGLAIGSRIAGGVADRHQDPVRVFGLAQAAVAAFGLISILFLMQSLPLAASIARVFEEMTWRKDVIVMLVVMSAGFLIPAILLGVSFPLICRLTTNRLQNIGGRVGAVYAIGTLGGIAGSLMAGFILLPGIGLQNSIFGVSAVASVTGIAGLLKSRNKAGLAWIAPASAGSIVALYIVLRIFDINAGLANGASGEKVFSQEGIMGTVMVTRDKTEGPLTLSVNNYQLATSGDVAVRFGHMPLLLKPDAKDVLLISLGSGITAGSIGGHPVERIDCVEIVPELIDVQRFFSADNHDIVKDSRFHLTFWDGRHYVRGTERKYDLVISDLFQPDSAGVGNLYSIDHFRNVKRVLKPGGAMVQWLPLYQLTPENLKVIIRTFAEAFENMAVFNGDINSLMPTLMLYGSSAPIEVNPQLMAQALELDSVKRDMIEHADPLSLLSFYVTDRQGALEFAGDAPVNTDNNPVIEYTAPKGLWSRRPDAVINFEEINRLRKNPSELLMGAQTDEKLLDVMTKYSNARKLISEGKVLHAKHIYSGELEKYQEAAKLAPGDPNLALAVFDLGYTYYSRRDYKTSAQLLDWAAKIYPDLLEAYFYLAKSYQKLGLTKEAETAFKELIKKKPALARELPTQ